MHINVTKPAAEGIPSFSLAELAKNFKSQNRNPEFIYILEEYPCLATR